MGEGPGGKGRWKLEGGGKKLRLVGIGGRRKGGERKEFSLGSACFEG